MLPVWENQPDVSGSSQGVVSHQEGNAVHAAKDNLCHTWLITLANKNLA